MDTGKRGKWLASSVTVSVFVFVSVSHCFCIRLNNTVSVFVFVSIVVYRQWDLVTGTPKLPGAEANAAISEKSRSLEVGGTEEPPCDGVYGTIFFLFML